MTIKLVDDRNQPKSRGGRALYTGLCRVARQSRSDANTTICCLILSILEGHVDKELALKMFDLPGAPKLKSENADRVLDELKKTGGEKLQAHLPETGTGLVDLAAKYGITK